MSETTPPRTKLERELTRIWQEVLQRAPIGIQEKFFDLGGTSVQAARMFAMIDETFHKRMPLSRILGAPTIEQLAASLDPSNSRDQKAFVVPIQPEGEKPALFCLSCMSAETLSDPSRFLPAAFQPTSRRTHERSAQLSIERSPGQPFWS